jgi:hypothetical protein
MANVFPDFTFVLSTSTINIDSTGTTTLEVVQTANNGFNQAVQYSMQPNGNPRGTDDPPINLSSTNNFIDMAQKALYWTPVGVAASITGSGTLTFTITATAALDGDYSIAVVGSTPRTDPSQTYLVSQKSQFATLIVTE